MNYQFLPSSETDRLQLEAWAKRDRQRQEYEEIVMRQAQEQLEIAKGMLPSSPLDEQSASQQSSGKKGDEYEHTGLSDLELRQIKQLKSIKAITTKYEELDELERQIKHQLDADELTLSEFQRISQNIKAERLGLEVREQQLRSRNEVQRAKAASTRSRSKSASASHRGPGSQG